MMERILAPENLALAWTRVTPLHRELKSLFSVPWTVFAFLKLCADTYTCEG
jgi:hypothetical protein